MAHSKYLLRVLHRPASVARVSVNGIPVYEGVTEYHISPTQPITHWLRRGENFLTMEMLPSPPSPKAPFLGPHLGVFVILEHDIDHPYFSWSYPDSRAAAGLPVDLPLVDARAFMVVEDLPEAAYLRGTPEEFPVEGTPAQHAAVHALYHSFATGDDGGFAAALSLKAAESERFYGPTAGGIAAALARLHEPWVMEPFQPEDLRFDRYLDGRVVYVRRVTGKPAVRAVHRDDPQLGWGSNFYMTRLDDRWQIFW